MNNLVEEVSKGLSGVGIVSAHEKGFGFINDETSESKFVPPSLMKTVVPGDLVSYTLAKDEKTGMYAVTSLALVERKESFWLGEMSLNFRKEMEFKADDPIHVRFQLPPDHGMVSGKVYQVSVPIGLELARTVPVKVAADLGPRNDRGFDVDYAIAKWRIPAHWTQDVLDEANAAAAAEPILEDGMADFTMLPFVTIDGEGTRDYDDAIYAVCDGEGMHLKVAIADVSRYVRIGSAVDIEARRRGTSVYFPDRVIPMLPESLSNGICSLNPGVNRSTLVCSMEIGADGSILSHSFVRALVRSHARLSFSQVSAYVNGSHDLDQQVRPTVDGIAEFYRRKTSDRAQRGFLEQRNAEPKLRRQTIGNDAPYDVSWTQPNIANDMVEECMLAANTMAAVTKAKAPLDQRIYRSQRGVDERRWGETREWLTLNGIEAPEVPNRAFIRSLLVNFIESPVFSRLEWRVRRSLSPAEYNNSESMHFTLGYDAYTHFTSPIRRYADLTVHRLILNEIDSAGGDLAAECTLLSQRSQQASRYPLDRMKRRALFREDQKVYPSRITKLTRDFVTLIVDGWQVAVTVPADVMRTSGYTWNAEAKYWSMPESIERLEEGDRVDGLVTGLVESGPTCQLFGRICP